MTTEPAVRRSILVPIDLHGTSRGSLETLVRLARLLDRRLLGLLLDDIRLQQVADLPFTTEISLAGGRERNLLRDHLSQRQTLVSGNTRRILDDLAQHNRVELAFENATGSRLRTSLERGGQLDIFFPARQRWQLLAASRAATGSAIRRLGIVLAGTAQDQNVVETTRLLQEARLVAEIYVISVGPLDRSALDKLYRPGSRICVQANLRCEPKTIVQLVSQSQYDLLLLPRDCLKGVPPEGLEAALDKASGQVLVIN